jgi:phospholipase D1/2
VHLLPGQRLYDALLDAAKKKLELRIYVLPWAGASAVPTYVKETLAAMESLNAALGTKRVFTTGAEPNATPSEGMGAFFSHHQKQAVVDERIAFVGGLDVAYGRRDDARFSLDATRRVGNDAYNGCLPHLQAVTAEDYVDCDSLGLPDTIRTQGGEIQNPYAIAAKANLRAGKVQHPAGGTVIDASRQPRLPWQDVHLQIEGPAVSDLASNFVLRWNSATSRPRLPLPPGPKAYPKKGSCQIQLLRSASPKMVDKEVKALPPEDRARVPSACGHNHIYHAMVRLIERAHHFIYIENQFFVSAFGSERFGDGKLEHPDPSPAAQLSINKGLKAASRMLSGNPDALPANRICEALGAKLHDVIMDGAHPPPDGKTSQFHVYITLPVHSEGRLNDPAVMTQVHFTMQTLVFGSQSLINRIRRAILARQLLDKKDTDFGRVFEDDNHEYESVPIDWCWPYVTLLNLRNWEKLGERYVTEQVYVHTKMMVVDDLYAIVGSANINDRSLLGDRDSEMAVLVMDKHHAIEDIGAVDGPQLTRGFARRLRMGVWNKIFGNTGGVRPAGLEEAIKRPAAQGSWKEIRKQAEKNSTIYDAAFKFIPANGRGIWPTKYERNGKEKPGLMPFDKAFWNAPCHEPAAVNLQDVKGYITLLPWLWTRGENNNSGYHSALFTNTPNDVDEESVPPRG